MQKKQDNSKIQYINRAVQTDINNNNYNINIKSQVIKLASGSIYQRINENDKQDNNNNYNISQDINDIESRSMLSSHNRSQSPLSSKSDSIEILENDYGHSRIHNHLINKTNKIECIDTIPPCMYQFHGFMSFVDNLTVQ